MSEVEALLAVDKGKVPPGAVAFFPRDLEAPIRRLRVSLAVLAFLLSAACLLAGAGRVPVALLLLASAMLGVTAAHTNDEDEDPRTKRATMVVTPTGLIIRDQFGLRTWSFDQLADVIPVAYQQRSGILMIKRDGSRDVIDNLAFVRGECLREMLRTRMTTRTA